MYVLYDSSTGVYRGAVRGSSIDTEFYTDQGLEVLSIDEAEFEVLVSGGDPLRYNPKTGTLEPYLHIVTVQEIKDSWDAKIATQSTIVLQYIIEGKSQATIDYARNKLNQLKLQKAQEVMEVS